MPYSKMVAWVDAVPRIKIDNDGVQLILASGDAEFISRMSPANFRQACVDGLRCLNAWEDRQEGAIPLAPVKVVCGH